MTAIAAARDNAHAMALMLRALGITITCAPVLDLSGDTTHDAIGDRSFGGDPLMVASLGRAMIDGLTQGGVKGVIKHIPGQGRAHADSHLELPHVAASAQELARDCMAFAALNTAPLAMVAHIAYDAWDSDRPASCSPKVIEQVIRNEIGFKGILLSDDITMNALSGDMPSRASACLAAGVDVVLHCSGALEDMQAIADAIPPLEEGAFARIAEGLSTSKFEPSDDDLANLLARRDVLLSQAR